MATSLVARVKGYLKSIAPMTNGQLLVGQTGGVPEPKTISGDLTIDADGVAVVTGAVAERVAAGAATAKTLASGAFALTSGKMYYTVAGEGGNSDDLDNITGGTVGDLIIIRAVDADDTITVRNNGGGAGNIRTPAAVSIALAEVADILFLFFDGTNWNAMPPKLLAAYIGTAHIEAGALAASVAGRALMADDFFDAATADAKFATDAIGEDLLTANELTGRVAANVADANVVGGIPVLHRIDVPAGTTGDVDVVLTHKTRVTDVWLVKKNAAGGGAGTIQAKNGSDAITDAMSIDINDKVIARATEIDDAFAEIAAAGTLKITRTRTASTDEQCTVYVLGVRVA